MYNIEGRNVHSVYIWMAWSNVCGKIKIMLKKNTIMKYNENDPIRENLNKEYNYY